MREPYDVLVIGGGPAGMAAATVAAEVGRKTALVESRGSLGGQIWRGLGSSQSRNVAGTLRVPSAERENTRSSLLGSTATKWLSRFRKSGAEVISHSTVFAAPSSDMLWAEQALPLAQPRTIELKYKQLVLATGARELFLPFPGWTLPGIVGPGGLEAMANEGWPVAGKRVVVAGSGPLVLAAAGGLKGHGAEIVAVAEQASLAQMASFAGELMRHPTKLLQAVDIRARLAGTPYYTGCWPSHAIGGDRLEKVTLTNGRRTWQRECDYLACAFGLVANVELPQMLGCKIVGGFVSVDSQQRTSLARIYAAGELTGIGGSDAALIEGQLAGLAAAGCFGEGMDQFASRRNAWRRFAAALARSFRLRDELKHLAEPNTIVCRCEDVRRSQLDGATSWRSAKLQTRCGMGPCQGRICGAATSLLYGWSNDSVRPPQIAVTMGSLAGPK